MGWNDLLKPSKAKLLLALLIFILFVPAFSYYPAQGCRDGSKNCTLAMYAIQTGSLAQAFLDSGYSPYLGGQWNIEILLPEFLAGMVISYLLACLLALIYSKYAKPKK